MQTIPSLVYQQEQQLNVVPDSPQLETKELYGYTD
jgi:hypothetical protein